MSPPNARGPDMHSYSSINWAPPREVQIRDPNDGLPPCPACLSVQFHPPKKIKCPELRQRSINSAPAIEMGPEERWSAPRRPTRAFIPSHLIIPTHITRPPHPALVPLRPHILCSYSLLPGPKAKSPVLSKPMTDTPRPPQPPRLVTHTPDPSLRPSVQSSHTRKPHPRTTPY